MPQRDVGAELLRLDEMYCKRVREEGTHGTWHPSSPIWPGHYGVFRQGVFEDLGCLERRGYRYRVVGDRRGVETIRTGGIAVSGGEGSVNVSDVLESLVSGGGTVSFDVETAEEVLILTRTGMWHRVANLDDLLDQVRTQIHTWPLQYAIVCRVFATPLAVIGISSRSTRGFAVKAAAGGGLSIVAKADGGGQVRRSRSRAAQRTLVLDGRDAASPRSWPAPLFDNIFRVRKQLWGVLGRPELVTSEGDSVSGRIPRAAGRLTYDARRAEISLTEAQALSLHELFEEVTPALVEHELATARATAV